MDLVEPTFLASLRLAPAMAGLSEHDAAAATVVLSPAVVPPGPAAAATLVAAEILRQEPADGTADAEPNHFAHVELASPDLPWRFTPAAAGGGDRLPPWLALVVVEERPGVRLEDSVLHVDDASRELPDPAQCWAWAHVQVDRPLGEDVAAAVRADPSAFRARLVCPRRLPPAKSWIACVVPAFEGDEPAWSPTGTDVRLAVHHSWRFSTGQDEDFETLVRRLAPREPAGTLGRRDLDVSSPGEPLPAVPELVLSFRGALLAPGGEDRPWPAGHRMATVETFQDLIRRRDETTEDDPVVGAPAYGTAQAHGAHGAWFLELNTEPPHRVAAALGAALVRRDREALMAQAWQHAAGQREVNRVLGRARLGWEVARVAQSKLETLGDPELLQLAGPALSRLPSASGSGTLRDALAESAVPQGLVSSAMRRRCRTVRGLTPVEEITRAALADAAGFVASWQSVRPPMGADLQTSSSTLDNGPSNGTVFATGQFDAQPGLARDQEGVAAAGRASLTGAAVGKASVPVAVVVGRAGGAVGRAGIPVPAVGRASVGGPTPPDAGVSPAASGRAGDRVRIVGQASVAAPKPAATDIAGQVRAALEPAGAIAKMVAGLAEGMPGESTHPVPPRVRPRPRFTNPVCAGLDPEVLLPGAGDIPPDTLGLLVANQRFVEAVLIGFNHELAREFRRRGYPVGLDETWATHFWDRGPGGQPDMTPMETWDRKTALGDHHPQETAEADLVLMVKSALPSRYPGTRVYAQEAVWSGDGTQRLEKEGGVVKPPVLTGKVGSDLHFYGFELSPEQARGGTDPAEHPGYFLVLEQEPEPIRFGPDAPGDDAAAMARNTLRRPARMLTHARGMLPEGAL